MSTPWKDEHSRLERLLEERLAVPPRRGLKLLLAWHRAAFSTVKLDDIEHLLALKELEEVARGSETEMDSRFAGWFALQLLEQLELRSEIVGCETITELKVHYPTQIGRANNGSESGKILTKLVGVQQQM